MTHLSACVDVSAGVANGYGTDDLAVIQRVDLSGVSRYPGADQCIGRERNRLHLSVGAHVEGISPESVGQK